MCVAGADTKGEAKERKERKEEKKERENERGRGRGREGRKETYKCTCTCGIKYSVTIVTCPRDWKRVLPYMVENNRFI